MSATREEFLKFYDYYRELDDDEVDSPNQVDLTDCAEETGLDDDTLVDIIENYGEYKAEYLS